MDGEGTTLQVQRAGTLLSSRGDYAEDTAQLAECSMAAAI